MGTYVRSARRIVAAVAAALVAYVAISAVTFRSSWTSVGSERADVIVVMGAAQYDGTPSEMLRQRLEHALELWRSKRAPLIAVTGGKKSGDRFTEAQSGRRWLMDRGVPIDSIVSEEVGRSTWESLSVLAPVLKERGVSTAIVVSTYWHVERSRLTLDQLGFESSASAVGHTSSSAWTRWGVQKEWMGVAIGRLIGFETLYRITG